ncbi:MAG: hypothetical protein EAZ91_17775 [Cytophagales bacterium]|nr:MAG: hypothetical protein EAZ91_17775 [Cytophagales bacterium]
MLGGIGLFYGAPVFRPERSLERTVKQYNGFLRSKSEDYYRPLYELGGQTGPLTLADTIERRKGAQFWYRGVRVDPADNLRLAFDRLNNGRLSGNMKYIRTGRWVSGFAGGLASGVLAGYLLGYALRRNNGSIYPADQTLIYSAAAVIGVTTIYNRVHLNHVQRGTVDDYNKRLREAIRGEGQE